MVIPPVKLRANKLVGVFVLQQCPALLETGLTKVPKGVGMRVLELAEDSFELLSN